MENGLASCDPGVEYASGNIYLRPVHLDKAGDCVPGHTHHFDHTTFVTKGSVHVTATSGCGKHEKQGTFTAGQHFLVKAEWKHVIVALEDGVTFVCIYAHRTPQGEVVQTYDGWWPAHACT